MTPEAEVEFVRGMFLLLAALVTAGFAFLGVLVARANGHARRAAEQVTNAHATNLRDDLDEKHADNTGRLGRLERGYKTLRADVSAQSRGIRRIEEHLGIEQTIPAPPRRKP